MGNETFLYMLALCLVWPVGYLVTRLLERNR